MEEIEKLKVAPHIKNKHTDDLIDHYWGSINYIAELIKAAEIKADLILTFYGILLVSKIVKTMHFSAFRFSF